MTPPRPVVPFVDPDGIPQDLRDVAQWIGWRFEQRGDDWSKTPINPNIPVGAARSFAHASSTNPATWTTFEAAVLYAEYYGLDGVGFVFTAQDDFVGIDLDHVRDDATGAIEPWAREIIDEIDSYSEISVSSTGVHIVARGKLPGHGLHPAKSQIEIYDQGRYFTFSGRPLNTNPVAMRAAEIDVFYARVAQQSAGATSQNGTGTTPSAPLSGSASHSVLLSDAEVIEHARGAANGAKFDRLMVGDTSDYGGDDSAADAALCEFLAFWTGGDRAQVDRIFRTSGLMRPKWDSRQPQPWGTYGARTIDFAFSGKTSFYSPTVGYSIKAPTKNGSAAHPPQPVADPADDDDAFHQTDYGNAEHLVSMFGHDLRYCASFGQWLVWDGRRFAVDQDEAVMRLAKKAIREIYREAAAIPDRNARIALAGHAKRSESIGRIKAMVTLAQSERTVAILPNEIDLDPWLLTVENGTINLRTGKLRPHDHADLCTKLAPVVFDSEATCPTWHAFIEQVLPSPAVRIFVQRAFGYSLTGSTAERIVLILYGIGANGKSTFLDIGRALLGDYAMSTTSETFIAKRDGGIPNDVARLKGARFVTAVEADEGKRLAEAQIKQMAGGTDMISARFMRGEWFDFQPEFKAWLATNHKPIIRGTDDGIWDRIRLISFPVRIPEEQRDKDLTAKLHAELPGILRWAVDGCLQWQQHGLGLTDEVRQATSEYRAEMDLLGHFIEDRCDRDATARETAGALYKAYGTWCEASGERPMTQINFGKRLKEMGFDDDRDKKFRYWKGLKLRDQTLI